MQIGTPLSDAATRIMLLGSGELGKEVIISLQRLGVEVIAVDRYKNAPGHQVAHRSYSIDMTNAEALESLINLEKPHYIVPEIEAINTDLLAKIEKKNDLTIVPSIKAVQLTMNRQGIRKLASETLNLPTSPYAFAKSFKELKSVINSKIGLPCFIKPTMSSSGKGQSRIVEENEITKAWDHSKSGRVDQGEVIVEGQVDFDYEITLLTVRAKNKDGGVSTHFCEPIGHRQENGDYVESWQPQSMSEKALVKSKEVAKKITDALGGLGIFGVELFIKKDEVWFSEVSPRPHDTGMVTMATQKQSEFELHAKAILGLPVDVSLTKSGASAVIYGEYDADVIIYDEIEKVLAIDGVDIRIFGKPESFKKRRMGVILSTGKNVDEAKLKASEAKSLLNVKPK
ncbi:formate-dependent phosphoribosylglycinamide formyltransferase [Nitrosomonadales bacterium]|nr:formate-dependent phosphoribosylglycinamide formyltransferase [Nitrosomonadales bacterium]